MQGASEPRTASQTAVSAAKTRAYHYAFDDEPKILADSIARRLLTPDEAPILARDGDAKSRASVVLRSRYAEERLEAAVARGVEQYILLGAGLDSFAYRQPSWASGLKIIEIDQPGSQADKRRRVIEAGITPPANLQYAPIDFEKMTLREGLLANGVDLTRPTFMSCLGVLIYLTAEAVDAIFELVAELPKGSEIAFSYYSRSGVPEGFFESVAKLNEPFLTFFEPEELARDLKARGFGEVELLSREAQRRYFRGRADGLDSPPWFQMAAAVVG